MRLLLPLGDGLSLYEVDDQPQVVADPVLMAVHSPRDGRIALRRVTDWLNENKDMATDSDPLVRRMHAVAVKAAAQLAEGIERGDRHEAATRAGTSPIGSPTPSTDRAA